ncbi:MAG: TetR/AcrR family transcriptional regulator [Myxococcales bacterium]|nr:TetR/AcrR family transcriptional regulator [Myxococcales bacterium]
MYQATRKTVGRPREFDPELALDAAMDLFWRNGFRATTTRDLKSALNLSESSIYNAFGSKDALLESALERYEQRVTDAVVSPLETSNEGLRALEKFFSDLYSWMTYDGRQGCMIINMMAEDGGATPSIARRSKRYRTRILRSIEKALKRAYEAGESAPGNNGSRASLLMGIVLGLNIVARSGASSREVKKIVGGAHEAISEWRL